MADDPYAQFAPPAPPGTAADPNDPYAQFTPSAPGMWESFSRGALSGATFGFEDELGIADRRRQAAAREANPWTSFAGEITGGFAPMVAAMFLPGGQAATAARGANLLTRAGALARRALVPGEISTLAQAMGQGAKLGAVYGGLSGAGHTAPADTDSWLNALGQRAIGTAKGAGTGLLFGGLLGGGLYGGSLALGSIINRLSPSMAEVLVAARSPESQGVRDIMRRLGYDGISADDLRALQARLADPRERARLADLNLMEALEAPAALTQAAGGHYLSPPTRLSNLSQLAKLSARTEGAGMHAAEQAHMARRANMPERIGEDVNRLFGPGPASRGDDIANLTRLVDDVTGSGNSAAADAARQAQREAFRRRYTNIEKQERFLPTGDNESGGILHLFRIPEFREAVEWAIKRDAIAASTRGEGVTFADAWLAAANEPATAATTAVTGVPAWYRLSLSPANVLDINHALSMLVRNSKQVNPRTGVAEATPRSITFADLKKQFDGWVTKRMGGRQKTLQQDYALFKSALEAENMGASLPLLGGGRNHPAMQFVARANDDVATARARYQELLVSLRKSADDWVAGRIKNEPAAVAARAAEGRLAAVQDVQDSFRRAWGESIREQVGRFTDPAQVANFARQALTPEGQQRVLTVLGPDGGSRFLHQMTLLEARNLGLGLGLSAGGGDTAAVGFLRAAQAAASNQRLTPAQRTAASQAVDAFRSAWGERIRQELGAATSPAAVNRVVDRLLAPEGQRRIIGVLGPERGRQFIDSLFNKKAQAGLSQRLYGGSETAYMQPAVSRWGSLGRAAASIFSPAEMVNYLKDAAFAKFQQMRSDQVNQLLSRQGPQEVGDVISTILARQQLRATGQPRITAAVTGPAAGVVPGYQNPVPQRRRQP